MEDSSTSSSIKDEAKVVAEVARTFDITLKEKQLEAIISFLKGFDVFITLPTGYGKSIIYGLLPSDKLSP